MTTVERQKTRLAIFRARTLTSLGAPICPICLTPLSNNFDMHEVILSRANVQGLPLEERERIFVPENVSLIHHGPCHEIAATKKGSVTCISDILFWEGLDPIYAFIDSMSYTGINNQTLRRNISTIYVDSERSSIEYRVICKWGYTPMLTFKLAVLDQIAITVQDQVMETAASFGAVDYLRKGEQINGFIPTKKHLVSRNGIAFEVQGRGRIRLIQEIIARAWCSLILDSLFMQGMTAELEIVAG
jgi:hypothetical protein